MKWEPAKGALLSLAYFDIEETNGLSQDPANVQNFLQGGTVGSKGVEFEATWRLPGNFELMASVSRIDAKVLVSSTTLTAGNRISNQPRDMASLWAAKSVALGNGWSLRGGAGLRHIGNRIDDSQTLLSPAVTLVDAMFSATTNNWVFSLTASNLFNKQYYAGCSVLAPTHGTCVAAKDRTAQAALTYKF